jgi:hypothetical protein
MFLVLGSATGIVSELEADSGPAPIFTRVVKGELVSDGGLSRGVAWGDFDNDGDPDLVVANSINQPQMLYRNDGPDGFFQIQQDPIVQSVGDSEGVYWADYDNDGDLDLYVGNFRDGDTKAANFFYLNRGDGSFEVVVDGAHVTDRQATYGASFVDVDEDGDLDLFLSNISRTDHNALYLNDGRGQFNKRSDGPLVTADSRPSKGHAWGDYDNDGDLDLFVANGTEADVDLRNFLYLNDGRGRFAAVAEGDLVKDVTVSAGVAWADYDLDGDLDLFVANWGGSDEDNALYCNQTHDRHWLVVSLVGRRSNRMGLGARVRLRAQIDGINRWQTRWMLPATGYASQNQPVVHFGLGDAARVDVLEVTWPSGIVDLVTAVGMDEVVRVVEGEERR